MNVYFRNFLKTTLQFPCGIKEKPNGFPCLDRYSDPNMWDVARLEKGIKNLKKHFLL